MQLWHFSFAAGLPFSGHLTLLIPFFMSSPFLRMAALKAARILRDDNPTPVTLPEACATVIEEYTDVVQCAGEMGLGVDFKQMQEKLERFKKRAKAVRKL